MRDVYHPKMLNGERGSSSSPGRAIAAIACLLVFTACPLRPSAPESRAEYFVKKLLFEPQAHDDLRAVAWLADGQEPESLLIDLPSRAAIAYLRARVRLDIDLRVRASDAGGDDDERRPVQVLVTEGTGSEPVRFIVQLEKREQEWRVTGLRGD